MLACWYLSGLKLVAIITKISQAANNGGGWRIHRGDVLCAEKATRRVVGGALAAEIIVADR